MPIGVPKRHTHITGTPLSECESLHLRRGLRVCQCASVLDLHAEHQFSVRAQRPRVRLFQIFGCSNAPDLCGPALSASPSPAVPMSHGRHPERVPATFHESPNALRVVGMTQQDTMHAAGQRLLEHPGIGANNRFTRPLDRQVHDNGRRPVTAGRGAPVHQAPHEITQAPHVEWAVLDADVDIVGPRRGHLHTGFVRQFGDADIVDRLPLFQQLNRFIDPVRHVSFILRIRKTQLASLT